ncbi:hypothetical protein ACW9H6_28870 [Pseudomonas sp. SDO528_S397]
MSGKLQSGYGLPPFWRTFSGLNPANLSAGRRLAEHAVFLLKAPENLTKDWLMEALLSCAFCNYAF